MDFTSLQSSLLGQSPVIIAGPCSAETQEQTLATARQLNEIGIKIFRAGLWKPRTMPGAFEGVGTAGLQWLRRVKEETGMMVATEVATQEHVALALKAGIDILLMLAEKSCQSRYRPVDRRFAACLQCGNNKSWCHPSWFQHL